MDGNESQHAQQRPATTSAGEPSLGRHLAEHRDRLRRMVELRLDGRLKGRVDPSDVVQEACLEASTRYAKYQLNPTMPIFLWLRFLTGQKLLQFHRRHLGVQARDVRRDVPIPGDVCPQASSAELAAEFLAHGTTPSEGAIRAESRANVQAALERMEPADREVLALRHFEQLTIAETAEVLGIKLSATKMRYRRALERLNISLTRAT